MIDNWKMTLKTFVGLKKDLKYYMCLKCKKYIIFYFDNQLMKVVQITNYSQIHKNQKLMN